MPRHVLPEGTILDNHYRIDSLLGEGGFGITYAACNIRLDSKVAIKELFWRDHSVRDASTSLAVALRREEDGEFFRKQKERFLREARMLRDFSNRSEIAHVLDYFEANDTAYIVMEYVDGQTLSDYVASRGPIPPEELFRRFLPLVETLSLVHRSGVIHRDISPDNIMVQSDGNLKLIDFGAAREYSVQKFSAIVTKASFAPPEQHDQKGKLGPWTDVYALCATLYFCAAGQPPVDSVQRMFLDDLRAPSELKPGINPECEAVILRGMELVAANRWQSMEALAEAMRRAISDGRDRDDLLRRIFVAVSAALLCVAIALGIIFNDATGNVVTETFCLIPPGDQRVDDFAQAQLDLKDSLDAFAGKDNYTVTPDGSELRVVLPLDLFEGREIGEVLDEKLGELLEGYELSYIYQVHVDWDDPTSSMFAGRNQIRSEEFDGETAIFSYEISNGNLTLGQRANMLMDFKTRLDALDTPYAVGTAYGNPNEIVFRIDPGRINRFIINTIGSWPWLYVGGEGCSHSLNTAANSSSLSVQDSGDGSHYLHYETSDANAQESLQAFTELLLRQGQDKLYLQSPDAVPIAQIELESPITDGVLDFKDFMFDGVARIDDAHRYLLDYFIALECETQLPSSLYPVGEGMWDLKRGDVLFDIPVDDYLGPSTLFKEQETMLRGALARINQETDYSCICRGNDYYIDLALPLDENVVESANSAIDALFREYSLSDYFIDRSITIYLCDEVEGQRYRIFLYTEYDSERGELYHFANAVFRDLLSDDPPPYGEQLQSWWDGLPLEEEYGIERQRRGME